MPIYEFVCENCQKEFEDIIDYNKIVDVRCPECGSEVKKKISRSTFHLKGGGWSDTGYQKIGDNEDPGGSCVRIPQYKDKNTGAVGFGQPEVATLE